MLYIGKAIYMETVMKRLTSLCHELVDKSSEYSYEEKQVIEQFDDLPLMSMVFSTDLKKLWYSKEWLRFSGWTLDEMQDWGWSDFLPDPLVPRAAANFYNALDRTGKWTDIYPILDANGQYRSCYCEAAPIYDEKGQVKFWLGSMTDIHDMTGIVRMDGTRKRRGR